MKKPEAFITERIFVKKKFVTDKIKKVFTFQMTPVGGNSSKALVCGNCVHFKACTDVDATISTYTSSCERFKEPEIDNTVRLWSEHDKSFSFGRGDLEKVSKVFGNLKLIDRRSRISISKYGLEFLKLKELKKEIPDFEEEKFKDQVRVAKLWTEHGYGQIRCPARYGKTVVIAYLACLLQQRTLFLAHQRDLLDQCYDTFLKFTNIQDITKVHGKKLIGHFKSGEEPFPLVTLAT